jgi:hypothetical protein
MAQMRSVAFAIMLLTALPGVGRLVVATRLLPRMCLLFLALTAAPVVFARELTATQDEVRQVLSGCWAPLSAEEMRGGKPSAALDGAIVCFDHDFGIDIQPASHGGRQRPMQGGASYAFEGDRLVMTPALGQRGWFWGAATARGMVSCDVHVRSNGIVILADCLSDGVALDPVTIGVVAPRVIGPAKAVTRWSQLRGCWYVFDRERIRSAPPGEVSAWGYCFDNASRVTTVSFWSTSFAAWRSGNGDGEGYGEEYHYTLAKSRLALWFNDKTDIRLDCAAKVVARSQLTLSDCSSPSDNGVYLWSDR